MIFISLRILTIILVDSLKYISAPELIIQYFFSLYTLELASINFQIQFSIQFKAKQIEPMHQSSNVLNKNLVLPRRSDRNVGTIQRLSTRKFTTNYYRVNLNPNKSKVYLYQAKFPENIPADSSQVFSKCILQLRKQLKNSISFICFTGKNVYGFKKTTISQTHFCEVGENKIQVQIKYTKQLSINTLLQDPKTRPSVFHFLNSTLKHCMRENNICEMGKVGAFYPKNQLGHKNYMNQDSRDMDNYAYLEQVGLSVLRGYKFTIAMINREMKLQLDVCSRVLQSRSLLQDIYDFEGNQQQLLFQFKGKTIITRYGNYKTYTIQDIDFTKTPNSTFLYQNQEKNFKFYFKKSYNIDIRIDKQPLILVKSPMKRQISKNQKVQQTQDFIYLIPELVSLTGMTDRQRANHESMKALAPFTKLNPSDRFHQSSKIIRLFNNSEILNVGAQQDMKGYNIPYPTIHLRDQVQVRQGSIPCRGVLLEPHAFKKWAFVYSNNSNMDFQDACAIEDSLRSASRVYGITYVNPIYIQVPGGRVQDFLYAIEKALQAQNFQIQAVFIILKQRQTDYYGKLKNYLINSAGIPSQMIQAKSLLRSKNTLSVASKIAIQMSCKAGSAPWIVSNNIPYLHKRRFAYASVSSSKGKGGFTVSFVGTINDECTKVFSQYKLGIQKKDRIDSSILKNWYIEWIKSYFQTNKKHLPQLLILYRQSVGDSLFKTVVEYQVTLLKQAILKVGQKTKSAFKPQILYIIVNKKINQRFYQRRRGECVNPEPGSVIIESMSSDDSFDFHLAAQRVNQGTCTPTHYIVGYDQTNMSQEDIIQFTYNQCYNYYNWQGTVKIPAMLQCANKLSKLAGQSIKDDKKAVKGSKIQKSYYFL